MSDALSTGMSALQLSWDTPYRILASLLSIGCACALFGWLAASSPLDALGHIGNYFGLPHAQDVTGSVATWLSGRKEVIGPVAGLLLVLGVLTNAGDDSIPSRWRGAPTALIALAVIWEVAPEALPEGLLQLSMVLVAAYVLSRIAGRAINVRRWLVSTLVNLIFATLFVLVPVVWMTSRTTPRAAAK